jgi:hypothetical protein
MSRRKKKEEVLVTSSGIKNLIKIISIWEPFSLNSFLKQWERKRRKDNRTPHVVLLLQSIDKQLEVYPGSP